MVGWISVKHQSLPVDFAVDVSHWFIYKKIVQRLNCYGCRGFLIRSRFLLSTTVCLCFHSVCIENLV